MEYRDLIGRPYGEMKCLGAVLEILRRMGRDVPATEAEAAERWGARPDADWAPLGTSVGAAGAVGDLIFTPQREVAPASVYVLVEPSQGRALTSVHDRGVCLVRLRDIPEPLTVWRLA